MREAFAKVEKAVVLYVRHFFILAAITAAFMLPANLLAEFLKHREIEAWMSGAVEFTGAVIFGPLFFGALFEALRLIVGRERAGFFHCVAAGVSQWFALLVNGIVAVALISWYLLRTGPGGLILMINYSFLIPVVAIEKLSGKKARDRSTDLTYGRRWKIAGSIAIVVGIAVGVQSGAQTLLAAYPIAWAGEWWFTAGAKTLSSLMGVLMHVVLFLYYRDAWLLDVIASSDGKLIVIETPAADPAAAESKYTSGRKEY